MAHINRFPSLAFLDGRYVNVTGDVMVGNLDIADNTFTVDTNVFYVDDVNDYIGMGSNTSNTDNQLHLVMTATKDILIDGATNPREIDTGVMRWEHRPAIDNTRCLTMNIDNDNREDTHGFVINFDADRMNESASMYDVNIDTTLASAGNVAGYEISQVGSVISVHGLHCNPGIDPIHQNSGSFGNVEQAFDENGGFVDVTSDFNTSGGGNNAELFSGNGDIMYIGMAAVFNNIEVILATDAGGAGIKPTFEVSNGSGGWIPFIPTDNTRGFRDSGIISWETNPGGWAQDTVNLIGGKYWFRIIRTNAGAMTAPVEDTIQVQAVTNFGWDKLGDLTVNDISAVAITGTSFTIGGNTLDTNEWAFLDGLDQALKQADSVQFNSVTDGTATLTGGSLTSVKLGSLTSNGFVKTGSGDGTLSIDTGSYILHSLAGAANDFLVASGANTYVKKTLAETGEILEADIDHGNIQGLSTGADHSYIDQSVISGSTPTFTATNITGVPATSVLAGIFSGNFTFSSNPMSFIIARFIGSQYIEITSDGGTQTIHSKSTAKDFEILSDRNLDLITTGVSVINLRTNSTLAMTIDPNQNIAMQGDLTVNGLITSTGTIAHSVANAGNRNFVTVFNSDNSDLDSRAVLRAAVGGTSSGDPYLEFLIQTQPSWIIGVDNSDSDKLKIGRGAPGIDTIMTIATGGRVGINISSSVAGKLHIDQSSDSDAIPVLVLDQADISEGFINFIGSSRGIVAVAASVASVRVEIGGTVYVLALYADQ